MAKARRGGKRTRSAGSSASQPVAREHWRADGSSKAAFPTQDQANRSSLRLRLERGADLDPYQCSVCGSWHLGNRPG